MEIGERLKNYRIEKEMTQEQVAELAGVTPVSLSRWENGERNPTFESVEKVAAALGVSMAELTREPEKGRKPGFRKIIDGKLYDTGKAEVLFKFRRKYIDTFFNIFTREDMQTAKFEDSQYLRTDKGAYLFYCPARKDLQVITEQEVEKTVRELDADAYIRLFGQVEEG